MNYTLEKTESKTASKYSITENGITIDIFQIGYIINICITGTATDNISLYNIGNIECDNGDRINIVPEKTMFLYLDNELNRQFMVELITSALNVVIPSGKTVNFNYTVFSKVPREFKLQ